MVDKNIEDILQFLFRGRAAKKLTPKRSIARYGAGAAVCLDIPKTFDFSRISRIHDSEILNRWRGGEEVTRRSAKPLCEGSSPSRASKFRNRDKTAARGCKSHCGPHKKFSFLHTISPCVFVLLDYILF
jgi:hypothetical protein